MEIQKESMMKLKFWGVRGSIPSPDASTIGVGGNTSCVSVQLGDYWVIFDAGTGLRKLGVAMMKDPTIIRKGSIFLSHYHWDHVQGFPFFIPLFFETNQFDVYGEAKYQQSPKEHLERQMVAPSFPVEMERLQGVKSYHEISPDQIIEIDDEIQVKTVRLLHPNGGAVGFRLEYKGKSVCYISDHEHPSEELTQHIIEFVKEASVLIHDCQYTPDEKLGQKAGWGHSSWKDGVLTAKEANVDKLYLFHHEPVRTDEELQVILKSSQAIFANTELATENTEIDLL